MKIKESIIILALMVTAVGAYIGWQLFILKSWLVILG